MHKLHIYLHLYYHCNYLQLQCFDTSDLS